MPSINVRYFASLREKAGVDSENLNFDGTYDELYQWLCDKYQFSLPASMVQVAVNDEFSSMNDFITPDEKIVFIPPVAGG
jgi:molybdopterin converting factor subunit 1